MLNKIKLYLEKFDWVIFSTVLLLASIGLIEIYSIALGQETLDLINFQKHVVFIIAGIILLFLFSFIDYHILFNYSKYFYAIGLVVLIAVLVFGQTIRGTTGWFYFLGFSLQPVEFIKIILILFLAKYFSIAAQKIRSFKQLFVSFVFTLPFFILILMQPDFGSAILLLGIWFILILVVGFNKKYYIIIGLLVLIAFASSWSVFLKDYQKERILTFINPSLDYLDKGYNAAQAMIAVGSGRLIGRGVGFGSQSQLKFLPEAQNDFIFAVIAEELGFLGVLLLLFLYTLLFLRIISHIKHMKNDFTTFFLLGSMGLIFIEMFINIGMNIGIMPIVGISLPFVSYGGSSIIASFILIGIIQSIIIRSKISY